MKPGSKRRRTKQEIKEEKLAAVTKAQAIEDKLKALERLVEENAELKQQQEAGMKAQQALQSMMESGFVGMDENGTYVPGQAVTQSQQY